MLKYKKHILIYEILLEIVEIGPRTYLIY